MELAIPFGMFVVFPVLILYFICLLLYKLTNYTLKNVFKIQSKSYDDWWEDDRQWNDFINRMNS